MKRLALVIVLFAATPAIAATAFYPLATASDVPQVMRLSPDLAGPSAMGWMCAGETLSFVSDPLQEAVVLDGTVGFSLADLWDDCSWNPPCSPQVVASVYRRSTNGMLTELCNTSPWAPSCFILGSVSANERIQVTFWNPRLPDLGECYGFTYGVAGTQVSLPYDTCGSVPPPLACADHVCIENQWVTIPKASGTLCRVSSGICDAAEVCDGIGTACPDDTGDICINRVYPLAEVSGLPQLWYLSTIPFGPSAPAILCSNETISFVSDPLLQDLALSGTVVFSVAEVWDDCSWRPPCPPEVVASVYRRSTDGILTELCTTSPAPTPSCSISGTVSANDVVQVTFSNPRGPELGECYGFTYGLESTWVSLPQALPVLCANMPRPAPEPCGNWVCSGDQWVANPKPAGTVCRGSSGACDIPETCDGTATGCPPDAFSASGTLCRQSAGECDIAEYCTGTSAACPGDAFAASGVLCRPAAGECDVAEYCIGTSAACPADVFQGSTVLCRAGAGPCDAPEYCTGASIACAPDALRPSTYMCRPAAGPCDVPESCTGISVECPADALAASGSSCSSSLPCRCNAAGACLASQSFATFTHDAAGNLTRIQSTIAGQTCPSAGP